MYASLPGSVSKQLNWKGIQTYLIWDQIKKWWSPWWYFSLSFLILLLWILSKWRGNIVLDADPGIFSFELYTVILPVELELFRIYMYPTLNPGRQRYRGVPGLRTSFHLGFFPFFQKQRCVLKLRRDIIVGYYQLLSVGKPTKNVIWTLRS